MEPAPEVIDALLDGPAGGTTTSQLALRLDLPRRVGGLGSTSFRRMGSLRSLRHPISGWDMSSFRGWPEQLYYEGVEGMHAFLRDWFEPFDDLDFVVEGCHEAGR